jgi:hypothetical protein
MVRRMNCVYLQVCVASGQMKDYGHIDEGMKRSTGCIFRSMLMIRKEYSCHLRSLHIRKESGIQTSPFFLPLILSLYMTHIHPFCSPCAL